MRDLGRGLRLRGPRPGLALLLALTACGGGVPGPVGEPSDGYEAPTRVPTTDGFEVRNSGPAERLTLYAPDGNTRATLLFLSGRAATRLEGGASAWADQEGARVVRFDGRGLVTGVLGGAPPGGAPLTRPVFVDRDGDAVLAVELDGRALSFRVGEPERWVISNLPGGAVGGLGGVRASTRTVFNIRLLPLGPEEPLLWVADAAGVRTVGRIRMPEQAMLASVVNAGWVAPTSEGSVVFASAVRPELQWYGPDGALAWTATWPRPGAYEPRFTAMAGTLTPDFRLVQQAVAVGPDGLIYVLATSGDEGPADRLLVFDTEGTFLREGDVASDAAIYVGPRGHVYTAEPAAALARTEQAVAAMVFEPFDLPVLDGEGRVRLEDHRGKVVVVNFWASWCPPCRGEMPLLDQLSLELDPARAVVLGLNEDVTPAAGAAFLEELGGVGYRNAEGGGGLRPRYGYRGLPYTVVLDSEGQLIEAVYGFGDSIDPVEQAVLEALGAEAP